MSRTAFTLRIDAEERVALENLSRIEGRPMNQLLNEAIKGYLRQKGKKERSLEANLAGLRAYRRQDPEFRKAMAEFVEAEATLEDPLEGEIVEAHTAEAKAAGPVQSKIRDILGA
jgi:predicted transcriptional regulator